MFHVEHLTFLKAIVNPCKLLIRVRLQGERFSRERSQRTVFLTRGVRILGAEGAREQGDAWVLGLRDALSAARRLKTLSGGALMVNLFSEMVAAVAPSSGSALVKAGIFGAAQIDGQRS